MTARRHQEIVLRRTFSRATCWPHVGAELSKLIAAREELTDYVSDEPHEETLGALIEPELPAGPPEEWFAPYAQLGFQDLEQPVR